MVNNNDKILFFSVLILIIIIITIQMFFLKEEKKDNFEIIKKVRFDLSNLEQPSSIKFRGHRYNRRKRRTNQPDD